MLQLDLIDLGAGRDDGFRYVLVYIDLLTRHVWLRALRTKEPLNVAREVRTASCLLACPLGMDTYAACVQHSRPALKSCQPVWHVAHLVPLLSALAALNQCRCALHLSIAAGEPALDEHPGATGAAV